MKDALFEIGVEPLPARFVPLALEHMKSSAEKLLQDSRLKFKKIRALGSFRRLALIVEGLEERSEPGVYYLPGPKASLLKNEKGEYTPQALGFARSQEVRVEDLEIKDIPPKGEVLAAKKVQPSLAALKILPGLFKRVTESLRFPVQMAWEPSGFLFARPIRNLVALYGKVTLRIEIAGVQSGNKTFGCLNSDARQTPIPDPSRYLSVLKNRCALADPVERKEALIRGLDQAVKKKGYHCLQDEGLLEEVTHITEHPVPVLGQFSLKFLKLPPVLLLTVFRKQLKLFAVLDPQNQIQPYFVAVRDGSSEGLMEIQEGYERVVEARLSDAVFFMEKDSKTSLVALREKLKTVTYHSELGSLYDKSERVLHLANWICGGLQERVRADGRTVAQIAKFCYADLVSEVVQEFPELQGTMGGEYALQEKLPEKEAQGIADFYKPISAGSEIPESVEAAVVSVAGKLDSIVGQFYIGHKPSGSEDPFALRRQGTGVIRILIEKDMPVSLPDAIARTLQDIQSIQQKGEIHFSPPGEDGIWEDFFWQRAEIYFLNRDFAVDEVRAVREKALHNLPQTLRKLQALHHIRKQPEFGSLVLAFKRASNILKQAGFSGPSNHLHPELLKEDAETALLKAFDRIQKGVRSHLGEDRFEEGLRLLLELKNPVDHFFDKVLVMAEDASLREARLRLLSEIVNLFKAVADLSQLQG